MSDLTASNQPPLAYVQLSAREREFVAERICLYELSIGLRSQIIQPDLESSPESDGRCFAVSVQSGICRRNSDARANLP